MYYDHQVKSTTWVVSFVTLTMHQPNTRGKQFHKSHVKYLFKEVHDNVDVQER